MTHHLVMPFSRPQHAATYARLLKGQGVVWHLLFASSHGSDDQLRDWVTEKEPSLAQDWIKIHRMSVPGNVNPCYWKINEFARTQKLEDGDHYTLMTDDNLWSHGFWPKLRQHREPVVVCAERRPAGIIPACEQSMKMCLFDLSMLTLRGDVYRVEARFDEQLWCADGMLAEELLDQFRGRIGFVEGAYLYWNMLNPEDWGHPQYRGEGTR